MNVVIFYQRVEDIFELDTFGATAIQLIAADGVSPLDRRGSIQVDALSGASSSSIDIINDIPLDEVIVGIAH